MYTHKTVSNVSKCQSQSRFRILNFRKVNNNIYIIIYFEHFLLQNEFDTFDFDTFDTHFVNENQEKCGKSRLVTTSAPKHFTPKVAYFYPKSGVVLGARTYMKPLPSPPQKGRELVSAQYYSRTLHLAPSKFAAEVEIKLGNCFAVS